MLPQKPVPGRVWFDEVELRPEEERRIYGRTEDNVTHFRAESINLKESQHAATCVMGIYVGSPSLGFKSQMAAMEGTVSDPGVPTFVFSGAHANSVKFDTVRVEAGERISIVVRNATQVPVLFSGFIDGSVIFKEK